MRRQPCSRTEAPILGMRQQPGSRTEAPILGMRQQPGSQKGLLKPMFR